MTHKMKLNKLPFEKICSGQKTIELRLNDEKRKKIHIDDLIEFTQIETGEKIIAKVIGLHNYSSFKELYEDLPLLKCGYTEDNITTASPDDMGEYYTIEQQIKYGVLGIEIKLVESG